jgi:hypothetical protein
MDRLVSILIEPYKSKGVTGTIIEDQGGVLPDLFLVRTNEVCPQKLSLSRDQVSIIPAVEV